MPLPTASVLAARVKATWEGLDPDGFGSLSADNKTAMTDGMVLALCTELLAAMGEGTISVNGTTASACGAGGAAGTCIATGSMS